MAKYRFWQAPFLAFFSKSLYRDVADNWGGCGALYIFLLSSVAWFASAAVWSVPFFALASNKDLAALCTQLPKMHIVDGKMTIDKQSPYVVVDKKSGAQMIKFEMNRVDTRLKDDDPPMVVTATAVIMRSPSNEYREAGGGDAPNVGDHVYDLLDLNRRLPEIDTDGNQIWNSLSMMMLMIPMIGMVALWPIIFIGHVLQLLIFGGVAMMAAGIMHKHLEFEQGMRLAAIAITPNVILSTIATAIPHPPQDFQTMIVSMLVWSAITAVIASIYTAVIVHSLPAAEPQPTSAL